MAAVSMTSSSPSPSSALASWHTLRDVPRFPQDLEVSQSTYRGRLLYFLKLTDPRTLFTTPSALATSVALVDKADTKQQGWQDIRVTDYLKARQRVRAIVHPDSHQPILIPFRFSAFIPMNFINLCGMLAPSQQTPLRAMAWQFSNQTYNVGFNYCNSSGKDGLPVPQLVAGYAAATTTACGLSYVLNRHADKKAAAAIARGQTPSLLFKWVVPYTAVVAANIANLLAIRYRDVWQGIAVKDAVTGEELCGGEPSPRAGRLAVAQVGLSRGVMIPIPLMLFPPFIMNACFHPKKGVPFLVKHAAKLYNPVNVLVLVTMLGLALPCCIAIFPQDVVVPVSLLESKFQTCTNSQGDVVKQVSFNKGL